MYMYVRENTKIQGHVDTFEQKPGNDTVNYIFDAGHTTLIFICTIRTVTIVSKSCLSISIRVITASLILLSEVSLASKHCHHHHHHIYHSISYLFDLTVVRNRYLSPVHLL